MTVSISQDVNQSELSSSSLQTNHRLYQSRRQPIRALILLLTDQPSRLYQSRRQPIRTLILLLIDQLSSLPVKTSTNQNSHSPPQGPIIVSISQDVNQSACNKSVLSLGVPSVFFPKFQWRSCGSR